MRSNLIIFAVLFVFAFVLGLWAEIPIWAAAAIALMAASIEIFRKIFGSWWWK